MDKSLFTACRYTGKVRTEDNASEFRVCSKCGGITHKTVGAPRKTTYDLTVDNKVATTTEIIPETDLLKQEASDARIVLRRSTIIVSLMGW